MAKKTNTTNSKAVSTASTAQQIRLPLLSSKLLDADGSVQKQDAARWSRDCFKSILLRYYLGFTLTMMVPYLIFAYNLLISNAQVYGASAIWQNPLFYTLALGNLIILFVSVPFSVIMAHILSSSLTDVGFPESVYLSSSGFAFGESQNAYPGTKSILSRPKRLAFRGLRQGDVLEFYVDSKTFRKIGMKTLRHDNRVHFFDAENKKLVDDDYEGACFRLPLELLG